MSNYGAIPLEKCSQIEQVYTKARPSTWQFERNGVQYGGVEDFEFSQAQKDEITNLGGVWFSSAQEFLAWQKTAN